MLLRCIKQEKSATIIFYLSSCFYEVDYWKIIPKDEKNVNEI